MTMAQEVWNGKAGYLLHVVCLVCFVHRAKDIKPTKQGQAQTRDE